MNITRAKGYVLDTVRAYLATDEDGMYRIDPRVQRPLFLVGPPGIGKTAIMSQVANELGIGLVAYSMTHHTRQSALGLPVIEHREYKGFEFDASEYTMSEIIASIYGYMQETGVEQGILFLDEVNCVSETLYPSMLQFLQFKTFGKHAVPQGWIIVCAGNPPEYNRSVHEFDVVTLDRIRRIEVEPDVDAWRSYAADAGMHPAVTTFLETERSCFYRIESTPGGKRFVTARGWEDLSRMIALNESMGIGVERELIEQFVQDDEIAEKFSLYYDLFSKYQSDYQIPKILAGEASDEIVERAKAAPFDERMALLGLLLDALTPQAVDVQLRDGALTEVRDILRAGKPAFLDGGSVADLLGGEIVERERELRRLEAARLGENAALRCKRRVLRILKACEAACAAQQLEGGDEAFLAIHQEFRGYVGAFEADVSSFRSQLEAAFGFLENAFGPGNETLLLATEITARHATAYFVSRYGCEAFARNSQGLQTVAKQRDLFDRIDAVRATVDGRGGLQGGDARADVDAPFAGEAAEKGGTEAEASPAGADSPSPASKSPGRSERGVSHEELVSYYERAQWEYGYASLCHMSLPADLEGKTVLDVGCRRGKGVFKLSDRVGANGHAIGVDWVPDHIEEATSRMDRAARETGLSANNMEFHLAYPEELVAAGLGDNTVDMAFVNSVLHLTFNPRLVLAEAYRVLKPGGMLVCEVALASAPRDGQVVQAARSLGNSIQSAPYRAEFEQYLEELGFALEIVEGPTPVEANMGFKKGHEVSTAPSEEDVTFEALVVHCRK